MSSSDRPHPLLDSALEAARCLAADYFPVSDREIDAQTRIYRAIETRQLDQVVEAMNAARLFGNLQWRKWESAWRMAVEHYIGCERREAA
jgi:hypothetical protein